LQAAQWVITTFAAVTVHYWVEIGWGEWLLRAPIVGGLLFEILTIQ
jgi:hypothetical protein